MLYILEKMKHSALVTDVSITPVDPVIIIPQPHRGKDGWIDLALGGGRRGGGSSKISSHSGVLESATRVCGLVELRSSAFDARSSINPRVAASCVVLFGPRTALAPNWDDKLDVNVSVNRPS